MTQTHAQIRHRCCLAIAVDTRRGRACDGEEQGLTGAPSPTVRSTKKQRPATRLWSAVARHRFGLAGRSKNIQSGVEPPHSIISDR